MQTPSIGRVVHFYENAQQAKPWAATVVDVHSATCINVAGFNNGGTQFSRSSVVEGDETSQGPHWSWPPRT